MYGVILFLIGGAAFCLNLVNLSKLEYHKLPIYGHLKSALGDYGCFQVIYAYIVAIIVFAFSDFTALTYFIAKYFNIQNAFQLTVIQISSICLAAIIILLEKKYIIIVVLMLALLKFIPLISVVVLMMHQFQWSTLVANYQFEASISDYSVLTTVSTLLPAFVGIESIMVFSNTKNSKDLFWLFLLGFVIICSLVFIENFVVMGSIQGSAFNAATILSNYAKEHFANNKIGQVIIGLPPILGMFLSSMLWLYFLSLFIAGPSKDGVLPKFLSNPFLSSTYIPVYLALVMSLITILGINAHLLDYLSKASNVAHIIIIVPYVNLAISAQILMRKHIATQSNLVTIVSLIAIIYAFMSLIGVSDHVAIWAFIIVLSARVFFVFGDIVVEDGGAMREQKFNFKRKNPLHKTSTNSSLLNNVSKSDPCRK